MSLIFPSFKANDQTSIGSFAGPGPLVPAPIFNPFDYSCNGYFGNVYPNSNGFFPFPPLNSTIVPFQKSFPLDTTVQNVLSQDCSVKPRRDPLSQKEEKRSGRFELNPRASEFSSSERKSSSLIFEQLVEKSLDSLEAIRIGSKFRSTKESSTETDFVRETADRSIQTATEEQNRNATKFFLENTFEILDRLEFSLERIGTEKSFASQFRSLTENFDELRRSIFSFAEKFDEKVLGLSVCRLCRQDLDENQSEFHDFCRLIVAPPKEKICPSLH